jgi:hypothetical protein
MRYPKIISSREEMTILFDSGRSSNMEELRRREIEVTVDFDEFRAPIGLEIINVLLELGVDALTGNPWLTQEIPFSYDEETDAFYVRLSEVHKAPFQTSQIATALLNSAGTMLAIRLRN